MAELHDGVQSLKLTKPKLIRQIADSKTKHYSTLVEGQTRFCTCCKFTCDYVLNLSKCKTSGDSGVAYKTYLHNQYQHFESLFDQGVSRYCMCGKHCHAMQNEELPCQFGGSLLPYRNFVSNMYLCL